MHKHLIILIALAVLLVTACNPQPLPVEPTPIPTLPPATLPAEPAVAPPANEQTETTETTETVDGAQAFDTNCSACHDLSAETKIGPGLAGLFDKETLPDDQPVDDENLKQWILTGGGAMPGMALENDELDALVAFLRDATQ
ncbi:MAG: cytochrome c [Chloroflexi bacterium]|nr:cytochrome c [Chloroflexota bacterium]